MAPPSTDHVWTPRRDPTEMFLMLEENNEEDEVEGFWRKMLMDAQGRQSLKRRIWGLS